MELRTMRYIVAVAEECHFGRAARRVHIAQPALSQQIIALEAELGVQLFVRSTRRVEITGAGQRLLWHARQILDAADRAAEDIAAFAAGRAGRVSVGFVGTATYDVLPRLTRLVHAQLPDIDLHVRGELLSPQLLAGLGAGDYDLVLVRPPVSSTGVGNQAGDHRIALEVLRTEELLAVLSTTHRLAAGDRRIDLADLCDETFVIHPSGARSSMHHRVLDACARAGFRPSMLEVNETATQAVTVAAGLGVALAPEPVRSLSLDGVVYRRLREPETVQLLLGRREADPSAAVAAVASLIRAVAPATS
jgi:DNA-binding transcriptional LysR family regulator